MKLYLVIKNFFKKYISQIVFFFKYKLFSTISLKKKLFFNFINEIFTKFLFFSTINFNNILNKVVFIKKKINNLLSNFTIKQFFNKNNFIKYIIIIFIIIISFFILYIFYIVSPEIVIRYPFTDAATGVRHYIQIYRNSECFIPNVPVRITGEAMRLTVLTVDNMKNSMDAKVRGLLYHIFKEDYVTYYIERSTY